MPSDSVLFRALDLVCFARRQFPVRASEPAVAVCRRWSWLLDDYLHYGTKYLYHTGISMVQMLMTHCEYDTDTYDTLRQMHSIWFRKLDPLHARALPPLGPGFGGETFFAL